MRVVLTVLTFLFGIIAHAAHLAPWNPDGDGMRAGTVESTLGYGFAVDSAETGVGIAAGVAVGLHGTDVAYAGYYTMVNGTPQDTLTSQGLQAVGVPQDWANGIDAGISMSGTMGVGAMTRTAGTSVVGSMQVSRSTTLYRAVKPDELQDIVKTGRFRIPDKAKHISAEEKYFTSSYKSAKTYGNIATEKFGDPPYTIIRTEIPSTLLPQPVSVEFGIPAYNLPPSVLKDLVPVIMK